MNSFQSRSILRVGNKDYEIYRLDALDQQGISTKHLPYSLRILLENLLRTEDGKNVKKEEVRALAAWNSKSKPDKEIAFTPSRVLLQDFTGVPAVVDLAAMRDAMKRLGGDPKLINPLQPASVRVERRAGVPAQQGTLCVPTLGTESVPQSRHRSSRHGHRAPGEPRISGACGLRAGNRRQAHGLSRYACRHRLAHHHDQWAGCARLGCRWN